MKIFDRLKCLFGKHRWDYWGNVFVSERKCKVCNRHDIKLGTGIFVKQIPVKRR